MDRRSPPGCSASFPSLLRLWSPVTDRARPRVPTTSFGSKADANGHYYVKGSADGVPLEFMIDTGATHIVLSKETAERLHVGPLNFDLPTYTANGRIQNAQITIHKLTIGPYSVTDIPAVVNGGALDAPLLGMSWLRLFRSIEIENGVMTLHY